MNILQLTTIGENAVLYKQSRDETLGGLESVMLVLNKQIVKKGHKVFIACSSPGVFFDQVKETKLEVLIIKTKWLKIFKRKLFPLLSLLTVINIIKKNKIDIIHSANFAAGLIGGIAGKICGIPTVISVHQEIYINRVFRTRNFIKQFISDALFGIIMCMRKWAANLTGKIIAVSDFVSQEIKQSKLGAKKIIVIPNAIEINAYNFTGNVQRVKEELSLGAHSFVVGYVGRLVSYKGVEYLINSFHLLKSEIENLKILIIGDGPERKHLEDLEVSKNFKKDIIFTGFRKDIGKLLFCLDVFILPSLQEGFGNVVLEAMAMGKPVIATENVGCVSLFKDRNNIIVTKPADSKAIADAITTLYQDETLREKIAQNGRNFVEKQLSVSLWADKYLNIFSEMLNKKKC